MDISFIADDKLIIKDGIGYEIDLTNISVPSSIHAVQWVDNEGWLEFRDVSENETISVKPAWLDECISAWDTADAAYQEAVNNIDPADAARFERDSLLSRTDWWATSDRTMTAEQTAYRQALRDITNQDGFPDNVTWPTKP